MAKNMPDAAMPLGDSRSGGTGSGVDTGPEHGSVMGPGPQGFGGRVPQTTSLGGGMGTPNHIPEPSLTYRNPRSTPRGY